jgi:hypothetical protein
MIQFNLLPDVKIEYIKAQKMRQTVLSVAIIGTIASMAIFTVSLAANQFEHKHMKDLSRDITSETTQLKKVPQINNILTVQNQLGSLPALHDGKPAVSRLFDYLNQLTPEVISLSNYTSDFTAYTVTIIGTSDTLSSVNKYVDTLKFTTYTTDKNSTKTPAFSNVVLTSFGLSTGTDPKVKTTTSSFTISLAYDPNIFDNKLKVTLNVPSLITTRSEVDKPKAGNALFQGNANTTGGSN